MSDASPDSLRDELARQLFIADNWRQPKEQSEEDWQEYPGVIAGVTEYHAKADAIMPTVRNAEAEAWDAGRDAGDEYGYQRNEFEHAYVNGIYIPSNPYRSDNE